MSTILVQDIYIHNNLSGVLIVVYELDLTSIPSLVEIRVKNKKPRQVNKPLVFFFLLTMRFICGTYVYVPKANSKIIIPSVVNWEQLNMFSRSVLEQLVEVLIFVLCTDLLRVMYLEVPLTHGITYGEFDAIESLNL